MPEYLSRMIAEKGDLFTRIIKLNRFIIKQPYKVTPDQYALMQTQAEYMYKYYRILCKRIELTQKELKNNAKRH